MLKLLPLIIGLTLLASCAQKNLNPDAIVQRFDTQVYFQDKIKNKSHQMTMEIVARRNQKMRLDAKVALGVHIASVLMTQEKVEVALHAEKKAFEGPVNQKVLQRTLGFPLHPLVLHAIIYRQGLRGQGWSCEIRGAKVQKCSQSTTGLVITWEDQEDAVMAVADSKSFNLQWRILPPENVEEKSNYFKLIIPNSYEKFSL